MASERVSEVSDLVDGTQPIVNRKPGSFDEKTVLHEAIGSDLRDDDLKTRKLETEKALTTPPAAYAPDEEFPDGGLRAWLVVLGTMCITFSTFGYVNAWGVFQAYYQRTLLKDSTPSNIAWIGSIQYSLVFIPGLFTGRMFDLGHFKLPFFLASCLLVTATFLVAECKEYYQFILCQGFATGIGSGILFGPAMGIISHWFRKKRGIALGMTAVGSSIGGTIVPIAANRLIREVGFPWTMRILGFVLMLTLGCANLTLERRLPAVKAKGGLLNFAAFNNTAYTIYCLSGFVTFLGLYTVLTYIDISAISVGINPDFAFYLISIANASSAFGRITAGLMSDRLGAINIMAPLTLIAGLITYAWPFATTKGSLIAIAILYGFGSGAYISLLAIPMMHMGEMQDIGRRVGMAMSIAAAGALAGPPISGAINDATGGFKAVGYYAGSMVMVAVAMMLISRQLHLKSFYGKF